MLNIFVFNQLIVRFFGFLDFFVFYFNVDISYDGENCSKEFDFFFWIINGVIGVFILFGNFVICVVFFCFENFRRSYMNFFLFSLVICDVFMVIIVIFGYVVFCIGC